MDLEDDMYGAESVDDDFYSGETVDYEFIDNDSDDSDDLYSHRSQQNYSILNEADIHLRQEDNIKKISSILSISNDAAAILLRHYNWSVSKVNDEWFVNEVKVRRVVGLLEEPHALPNGKELTCGICFEEYPCDSMSSAACGHPFCVTCWRVRALENGLSDVDARGGPSRTGGSRSLGAGSSKSRTSRNKGTAPAPTARSRNIDYSGRWSCEYCTFANAKTATVCQMCQHRR